MSAIGKPAAPKPIVIDASALVELLLRTATGERVREAVGEADLVAPDLANPEVVQALRGLERGGQLSRARAIEAVSRLSEGEIARVPTRVLLREIWALHANLSAYDACYVALARALRCPLLSADRRLMRAPALAVTLISV
jgi:predicted nucleic acid-binding protein